MTIKNLVISQPSGNYVGIVYTSNLIASMLFNAVLVYKKRSSQGVNQKAEC